MTTPTPARWPRSAPTQPAPARTSSHATSSPGWAILDRPVDLDGDRPAGAPRPRSLADELHALGYARVEGLLDRLDAAALTGRGGAHFGTAAKWRSVLAAGGVAVVVANAAESEPASAKDAALLQLRPHLVLDGLALTARALGARQAVVWVHEAAPALAALAGALRERGAAGLAEVPIRVLAAPATYLAGESSAIRRSLAGGPALPAPYQARSAHGGAPAPRVLVQNAETLARVALLARGHTAAADHALVTVADAGRRTVLEAGPADTVAGLLMRSRRGALVPEPSAVLLGGWAGTWLPWHVARAAGLAGALRHPASGAGLVSPLPPGACGLAETARILRYLARSGAGQCGPCVFGLPALADTAERLAGGRARRRDVVRLRRDAAEVDGRGACSHPDGAVRLLTTALATFATDVDAHTATGRCLEKGSAR